MKNCPHCDGKLKKIDKSGDNRLIDWDYSCLKCGRGWAVQPNGDWHSRFSAGFEKYSSTGEYKGEWNK